ncbi:hemolysin [Pasteurellaceae bacterium RH1A]|nr:hemolysin [Pasteurellaceae bacterium RH1A]
MSKSHALTKLALAVSLCCAGSSAWADISAADGRTQVAKKNGIEIVNIASPSAAGLSHNKYNKFNVDKQGAVLNNARQNGQSQLAGDLKANPNLKQGAAKVILNEVVSKHPSKLAGKQEVFGQKADYVLANPNGISVEGGGFINTSRASLVVGKPTVAQGKLTGYDVTGDKKLTTSGKITTSGDLDLIAPQVHVGGSITTSEAVNVVMGKNKIARDDKGSLTITTTQKTGQVLDGKVVGSIQAGRIRIHSADDRATITAQAADFQAKSVEVTAQNASFKGKVTRKNDRNRGTNRREGSVNVFESKNGSSESYQATKVKADNFLVHAAGKVDISGADIQAKTTNVVGGSVHLGAEKTLNTSTHTKNQTKGGWHRNETEKSHVETTHRTTVAGENVNLIATQGKVTADGAKISLTNGGIYGEQGIDLRGAKATVTQSASADFKNETAKLKTGKSSQESTVQHYTATELNVKDSLVLGGNGNVRLAGVTAKVDGDFLAKNAGSFSFTAEKTQEGYGIRDDMKFWGGIGGSKTLGSGRNAQVVHGSDVTVKGESLIDAAKGVTVSGSRVLSGGNGVVKGNKGALTIDSVQATTTSLDHARQGTIFDITKARSSSYSQTSTAQGSSLKSQSNLQLSADKTVSIVGSKVEAAGLLDIVSKSGIEIKGATNKAYTKTSEAGFNLGASFDSFKASLQKDHITANLAIDNSSGKPSVSSDVTLSKDKKPAAVNAEAKFNVGLNVYNKSQESQALTHTGSSVSGSSVALNAKKVEVSGSQVSATKGDLNIKADTITTKADKDYAFTNSVNNQVNVGFTGVVTNSKLTGTLGVDVSHDHQTNTAETAQVSKLSAKKDVNLAANKRIEHQGTQVQAGGNITESAKEIVHTTAQDTKTTFGKQVNAGASITASIDKDKAFDMSAQVSASGGRENSNQTTHTATKLSAGKDISVKADRLTDVSTQYTAGEKAKLDSQVHNFIAAFERLFKDKVKGGASVGVSASTADFQKYNVGVNVGANFEKSQSQTSTALPGSINAKEVEIKTGKLNSQANIHGSESVNIQASQSANFTPASNSQSQSGGGFDAKLGLGAIVVPAAGAALPSIDVSVSAHGNKGDSSQTVANTLSGKQVNIHSNGAINLQGTNVQATESAHISGNTVNISAGKNHVNNLAVNAGAEVNIGDKLSSAGFNAQVGVQKENSQTHSGVQVNGKKVTIQGQNGVSLTGVSSQSNQLNVDAGKGNLNLNAAQDQVNKTNVAASLNLSGGVADNKWTPSAGGASLDVNVVRNETHIGTVLDTNQAQVNAGGNANLVGSQINANQASGTVAGKLHSQSLVNKINETSVSLSANGSGKLSLPSVDKWAESAKKDWENGTLAGVKADAKVEVDVNKTQSLASAGLNAKKDKVVAQKGRTRLDPKLAQGKKARVKVQATTELKNKVVRPVTGVNVQIAKDNKLVMKARVQR